MHAADQVFEHRLDRTYQQAVRARAEVEDMADVLAIARGKLAAVIDDGGREAPMAMLARKLALAPAQVELVWAIVACSIDGRLVPHLEALGGGHARRGLSPAVYAMLAELDDDTSARLAHWLASDNALVETGLIAATEPASPAARAYVAAPRLIRYLAGEPLGIEPLYRRRAPADALHDRRQGVAIDELRAALARRGDVVVVIDGPNGSGRATAAACAWGGDVLVLDCARVAPDRLDAALLALRRECLLGDELAVIANVDHVIGEDARDARRAIGALVDRHVGPLIVTAGAPGVDLGTQRPVVRVAWQVADTGVRVALWRRALDAEGAVADGELAPLAQRYWVGPAAIQRAVASARWRAAAVAAERPVLGEAALAAGLRQNIAEQLGGLAQRVEVSQSWDDLILAEDTVDLIVALVGRVRHAHRVLDEWGYRQKIARGAGVAALFSGPPGTGKTMVAGLIARELDLELYQVDLSKVVSKWVGETEKNLARIFDGAEQGHALLLFDEADALFGARTVDAKSAADRSANLEVNYLLQRIEAFGGITVLTTNLDSAIDSALKRRLAAHVVFAAPDEEERERLWRRQIITGRAPLAADVDPAALARGFPAMTGANIRNAAIAAAFLAAADFVSHISHDYLVRAARAEYRSMGHMVSEAIVPRSLTTGRR
ncbi:MAG TPA: ATP-binding protein [Kofleriaceae bacterium]|nr:ATP-binding protein [Kofleriaceae bacterium]